MTDVIGALRLPPLPDALPRPVIDSHTHLDSTHEYSGLEVDDSLDLAARVGIDRVVDIGCDIESSRLAVANAERHPSVVAAVAMHPNDAARLEARDGRDALDAEIDVIDALAAEPVVRAVGETGLDYFRTKTLTGAAAQRHSFVRHIEIAQRRDLALVIHDRDAHADILEVLGETAFAGRVVMHCFSGDAEFARACLERGAYLSFPGVVTFRNAGALREALHVTPLDRLLVETDAPYLTAMPNRGRPNAPYLVPHLVRFIAAERGLELAELCDHLSANTVAAFGGEWGRGASHA